MNKHNISGEDTLHVDYTTYPSPSHAIISTIAVLENTEPMELDPVFDSVDPETIDKLFHRNSTTETLVVELTVADHALTIRNNGELTVHDVTDH